MSAILRLDTRYVLLVLFLSIVGVFGFAGKASATLAGENGLIVYVENDTTNNNENCNDPTISAQQEAVQPAPECPPPENQVVTTAPDGTSETVAATETDPITAATISAPNTAGNNEIVYAVSEPYCMTYDNWTKLEDTSEIALPPVGEREPCDGGWICHPFNNNVVLNHVEVDANGNPIGDPNTILDLDPSDENAPGMQMVEKLSYSPDGNAVVMTRTELTFNKPEDKSPKSFPTWTVEKVTVDTGDVETLVAPRQDPWVSAGYAQNGVVYYSMSDDEAYESMEETRNNHNRNINLWYIPAGGGEADSVQLTFSSETNEFFLSVAPDNSKVLVCDPFNSNYYYVNTADGSVLQINDLAKGFYPIGFSPDGTMLYGTYNAENPMESHCGGKLVRLGVTSINMNDDEEISAGIATAMRTALQDDPSVINDTLRGVEDWAPKYVAVANEPQVLGATTSTPAKLQTTGSNLALMTTLVGLFVVVMATLTSVRKEQFDL